MKKRLISILPLAFMLYVLAGCESSFLEKKPQKSLLVPVSLPDFQALLDNSRDLMNVTPYLTLITDGDFQISDAVLQSQPQMTQSSYIWSDQVHNELSDWDLPYKQIFYCNVVLDGLDKIQPEILDNQQYNSIKGSALFFRALAFFNLSQQFASQYDPATASQLPGIPLGLKADINQILPRSSIEQTYARIIEDLLAAEPLLETVPLYLTRPSKPAADALLAKVYLVMGDYQKADMYASACLSLKAELLDYNTLPEQSATPFPLPLTSPNVEVLFYSRANTSIFDNAGVTVDTALYNAYSNSDLRKKLCFNVSGNYKGSYTGSIYPFCGLSTNEVYLIKAECQARSSKTEQAMQTLNTLLEKRWVKTSYVAKTASSPENALSVILAERRKELVGRATRWQDLRRLNKQTAYAQVLTRSLSGIQYRLLPNDKRYLFKIPADQIVGSGIEQNP